MIKNSHIAILLMVFHHFFGFDDFRNPQNYYIESFNIHGISFERMLAAFGKICVSIFAFFSGYALYKWRIFDRLSAKYADIPCLAVILVLIYAFAFLLLIPASRAVALLQQRIHTLQYKKGQLYRV